MPFPYIEASGSPWEMGRQHGRQAAERAAALVEFLITAAGQPGPGQPDGRSREEVLAATKRFLPLFEEYCPAVLEEVRGLAEGAELRFEEALLLQIRGEVSPLLREEGCT